MLIACCFFCYSLAVALSAPNAEELCIRGAANDMVLQGVMQAPLETDLHTKGMLGMACNDLSVSESGEKNTNHFQTNPFRRPLGCNFASFPFSGVGLFFSLAFCHFPFSVGPDLCKLSHIYATIRHGQLIVFFFFCVLKILTHKMQRFIDGGHCMLTWGLLNGTQNDRWMMYTRVCTSYAAHRRSYPG